MFKNILINADSYKVSHTFQYPEGTEYVYSYIEARGGMFSKTVMFGLQMFIKEYLLEPITQEMIDEADEFWTAHGEPFYREGWEYILKEHKGKLPISIMAVPEGHVVPIKNVLATVVNTDPKCWWLTSFLETALLRAVWYPTTVATISYHCKQIIKKALEESSDDQEQIAFKLHDFGARGVSSMESAAIGGAAHLVNFMGTDTATAILAARKYYYEPMAGFSIPAAEHSTITSWGRDNEVDAYRNMIKLFAKPKSLVAIVSDSYDLMNAVTEMYGTDLKKEIIDSGATIVVRPDSGDPHTVPVEVVAALGEKFGYTLNTKGYKVLHPSVRVIQGDGITVQSLPFILDNLLKAGWAADNLAFGMGGGLLQMVNRDTCQFAMKCSAICVDGEWRDVYKDPKGDHNKKSKRGQLSLIRENGKWNTVPRFGHAYEDQLVHVYRNGMLLRDWKFSEIRHLANIE